MIHHVVLAVSDLERSGRFYDAVLGPLGWRRQDDDDERISWGVVKPVFFVVRDEAAGDAGSALVCFTANAIPAVKASWARGVGAGGRDDGAPAQRPEYGATYYSARILDPDGHRVEIAVGSN